MKRALPRILRTFLAILCFALVNAAFLAPTLGAALCLDPSPGWSLAAACQLGPAVIALDFTVIGAVLALTLLLGRVTCAVLCPLGVLQDAVIRIRRLFPGFRLRHRRASAVRYAALAACVACAAAGYMAVPALLDPYGAYGRIVTDLGLPPLQGLVNLAADWCDAHERYWLMSGDAIRPGLAAAIVAAATLLLVSGLACLRGRWFCDRLCPVGAALSLVARRPLLHLSVDPVKCVGCGQCERVCKTGCIDAAARTVEDSRCIRCFDCVSVCRKGAVKLW